MKKVYDEIVKSLLGGHLHVFACNDRRYLYVRHLNQFFEIDEEAYAIFEKVRNGFELTGEDQESFLAEWSSLKINKHTPSRTTKITRFNVVQKAGVPASDTFPDDTQLYGIAGADRCEFFVHLAVSDSLDYLNLVIAFLQGVIKTYKTSFAVAVKAPLDFFSTENIAFLKRNKIGSIARVSPDEYTSESIKELIQKGVMNVEISQSDFAPEVLFDSIKNFVRYTGQPSNAGAIDEKIQQVFSGDKGMYVPESFQNVYSIFKFLTNKGVVETSLALSGKDANVDVAPKGNCQSCWARNMCWTTAAYETFGKSPEEVSRNRWACEIIYKIAEAVIDLLSVAQDKRFESENSQIEFSVLEGEKLILVNP